MHLGQPKTTANEPAKASRFIDPKTGKLDYWAWLDAGAANFGKGRVLFEDDMPEAMESGAVKPQQLGVVASGAPENKRMPDDETFEEKRANFGYGSQDLAMNVAAKARGQQPGADAQAGQPGQTQPPAQAGQPGQAQPPVQGGTGQAGPAQAGTPQTTTPAQPGQTPQPGGGAQTGESTQANDPRIRPEDMGPTPSYEEWQASPWGQNYERTGNPGFQATQDPHAYPYPKAGEPPNTPEGQRIRELIEKYSKMYNVPVQLMFNKAHTESGGTWDPRLTNPDSGAMGLFQFLPGTAKKYGVENAYDLEQNIHGASKYMAELLRISNGNPIQAEVGYHGGWKPLMGDADIPGGTRQHLGKVFPGQTGRLPSRMPKPQKPVEYPISPFEFWRKIQGGK